MMVTTAGSWRSATVVTSHDGPVVAAVLVATVVVVLVVDLLLATRPTTTAAATRTITPMASGTSKRGRREPGEDIAINLFWSPRAARGGQCDQVVNLSHRGTGSGVLA
jgi:hypothetical protein